MARSIPAPALARQSGGPTGRCPAHRDLHSVVGKVASTPVHLVYDFGEGRWLG